MRFTFAEAMCDPFQLAPLAKAAEEAGYHSFSIPDSIIFPAESDTQYPYNDDGTREFLEGKPFIDPFVPDVGAWGLADRRSSCFTTFVDEAADPPAGARGQAGDLGGEPARTTASSLGVGLSPWPEDYLATGTEWRRRGKRMDEMIEILKGLTSGEYFSFQGEFYDIPKLKLCPVPTQKLPILIGGHADAALRRAARCDGWMHGGGKHEKLDDLLAKLARFRKEAGTDGQPYEIHVISMDAYTPDGVRRLEDQGVTDCVVGFRNAYAADDQTLEQKLGALRGFADNVIAKV